MPDKKEIVLQKCKNAIDYGEPIMDYSFYYEVIALLKEQDELIKHEYWRGYNNGRADERGLQEGTIMQTFSPD